jgi:NAD(P)H-hydrate repair Nnr-like enzyme with NAD(P)H-hydrate epimerase domain
VAWKDAAKKSLTESAEVAPYKLMQPSQEAVAKVALEKLRIFNNIN